MARAGQQKVNHSCKISKSGVPIRTIRILVYNRMALCCVRLRMRVRVQMSMLGDTESKLCIYCLATVDR